MVSMGINTVSVRQTTSHQLRNGQAPFRMRPIAVSVFVGMAMMTSGSLYAAEPTVAELQAEIAQLKQIIEAQKAAEPNTTANAPVANAPVANAPAEEEEQQALGEVTVRGAPPIAALKDVPASISVVSGEELSRLSAKDISSITKRAGNISWNQGNQRSSSLSIRGLGRIGTTEAQDPSVGVTVDGVSYAYNALTSSYDFNDVDTVQVGRGPQGTLGGKNSNFGVVNINTVRPSFTPSTDYSLLYGQRNTVNGVATIGGPIEDDLLAWRGSFSFNKADGDMKNLNNPDQTFTNTDRASGKVQFLLTPTKDFNARLSFDVSPRNGETTNGRTINTPTPTRYSNGTTNTLGTDASTRLARDWFARDANYSYAGTYLYGAGQNAVARDGINSQITGTRGATAELNWNLGTHTLTSITAYRDYHFDALNDEGTPFDINTNSGGFLIDYKQVSQELRLSSELGGAFDYQAGLYFLKTQNEADYQRSWGSDAGAWNATTAQYNRLNTNGSGRQLMQDSLNRLAMFYNSPSGSQDIQNTSNAMFGQANWHVSDKFTLTAGARLTREDRQTTGSSSIVNNGVGSALNPVAVNNVSLGGFASDKSTGALVAGANSVAQLRLADQVANKYFGVPITATPGDAYNIGLSGTQRTQIADAKAIRASQIGVLFNQADAEKYSATLPTLNFSPSYKFSEDLTGYVSFQYGEKAGISQFTNGISNKVKSERTMAYELGLKSALFDKTLLLNADLFLMNIANYQQAVRVLDVYSTSLNQSVGDPTVAYTSATGSVPKVQAKGLEFDGVYSGIKNTTIRFSGAYNDAVYKDFTNSAQPVENGYSNAPIYQDVTGRTLPGAAKFTFNVGVDYRLPVLRDKMFHTSFNTSYTTKYNSDVSLSDYAWIPANSITDFAIGLGNQKQTYDVSLLVKNLFDDTTPLTKTWNSYTPANPRWIGIVLSGKL
jgi:iron complex outermembrane receptor protein